MKKDHFGHPKTRPGFDTIHPVAVKESLLKHGGDEIMVNWSYNCITHRNIYIIINGEEMCLTL